MEHLPGLEILQHRVDLRLPYDDVVWIEQPYVARGAVTLFAGREGEGKSMVMQDAAIRYARNGYRVLLVDVENGPRVLAERLHKLGLDPNVESDVVDKINVFAPTGFDLNEADDFMGLQNMIVASEPDVMILDSLRSLTSASLASPRIKGLINLLRQLAQNANMGLVVLHHTTKSGNTYLGSGAIGGTVEMVYFMLRHKDDPDPQRRVISCFKQRLCREPDDAWIQITSEANGKVIQIEPAEPFVEEAIKGQNQLTARIMMALIMHEQSNPNVPYLSMSELCKASKRDDKDRTVRRVVDALMELGHIVKAQDPASTAAKPRWVYRCMTEDIPTVLQSLAEAS